MFKWLKDWRAYNTEFKRTEGIAWFEMLKESVEKDLKDASERKLSMLAGLIDDLALTVDKEIDKRERKGKNMYILIDEGCLECCSLVVVSSLVGVYESKKMAIEIAERLLDEHDFENKVYSHYRVFEIGKFNETHPDYMKEKICTY